MAELSSTNSRFNFIPNIIARIRKPDELFIVMDLIDGVNMSNELSDNSPISYKKVIDYSKDICTFISYMHQKHYLFSDMKPDNIMILKNDESVKTPEESRQYSNLKFIDFGATIHEGEETTAFTPSYAAPEQFLGQFDEILPDKRTDIFNIGATIFHMAAGYCPENVFSGNGESRNDIRRSAQRFIFPKKSSINSGLKKIILKCVEDDRNKRYSSCEEIISDLEKLTEKKHTKITFSLLAFSAVLALTGTVISVKYNSDNNKKYNDYIDTGNYSQAIELIPGKKEAYLKCLDKYYTSHYTNDDTFFIDDSFTNEKTGFLSTVNSGKSELILNNSYAEIEYEISKILWFYSNSGTDNSRMKTALPHLINVLKYSCKNLNNVSDDDTINEYIIENRISNTEKGISDDKFKSTVIYYRIADFYSNSSNKLRPRSSGNLPSVSDLIFLTENTCQTAENDYIKLRTYSMITDLIKNPADYYKKSSEEEKNMLIKKIVTYTNECDDSDVPDSCKTLKNDILYQCS